MYQALFKFLSLVSLTTFIFPAQAEEPKVNLPTLNKVKTVSVLPQGQRQVIIIGEVHRSRIEADNAPEQKAFIQIQNELIGSLEKDKTVFLAEHTDRSEKQELQFLTNQKLDPKKIEGAFRGLENPHAKWVSTLGTSLASAQQIEGIIQDLRAGKITAAQQEGYRKALIDWIQFFVINDLPAVVGALNSEPGRSYFKEVMKLARYKNEPFFQAMEKLIDADNKHYADFEKYVVKEKAFQAGFLCEPFLRELFDQFMADKNVPDGLKERIPKNYFNAQKKTKEQLSEFLDKTSKIREEYMAENAIAVAKDFPGHNLVLIVGESHRLPLVGLLEAKLKK